MLLLLCKVDDPEAKKRYQREVKAKAGVGPKTMLDIAKAEQLFKGWKTSCVVIREDRGVLQGRHDLVE